MTWAISAEKRSLHLTAGSAMLRNNGICDCFAMKITSQSGNFLLFGWLFYYLWCFLILFSYHCDSGVKSNWAYSLGSMLPSAGFRLPSSRINALLTLSFAPLEPTFAKIRSPTEYRRSRSPLRNSSLGTPVSSSV